VPSHSGSSSPDTQAHTATQRERNASTPCPKGIRTKENKAQAVRVQTPKRRCHFHRHLTVLFRLITRIKTKSKKCKYRPNGRSEHRRDQLCSNCRKIRITLTVMSTAHVCVCVCVCVFMSLMLKNKVVNIRSTFFDIKYLFYTKSSFTPRFFTNFNKTIT
jgi:hypothetical protein